MKISYLSWIYWFQSHLHHFYLQCEWLQISPRVILSFLFHFCLKILLDIVQSAKLTGNKELLFSFRRRKLLIVFSLAALDPPSWHFQSQCSVYPVFFSSKIRLRLRCPQVLAVHWFLLSSGLGCTCSGIDLSLMMSIDWIFLRLESSLFRMGNFFLEIFIARILPVIMCKKTWSKRWQILGKETGLCRLFQWHMRLLFFKKKHFKRLISSHIFIQNFILS